MIDDDSALAAVDGSVLDSIRTPAVAEPGRSGEATVEARLSGGRLRVRFADGALKDARVAAAGYDEPLAGDAVVALVDSAGEAWVLGVVHTDRSAELEALLDAPAATQVHDRRGRLVFEYDAATDRAVLHVGEGDLDIEVAGGALSLSARDGVRIASGAEARLTARTGIELEVEAEGGTSRVAMKRGELRFVATALAAAAERAELVADRLGVTARLGEGRFDKIKQVARVIDTRAGRIVERAKDAYREVERLSQHRAGRLRWVAKKTASIVGEDTVIKARRTAKVKGERIHLA